MDTGNFEMSKSWEDVKELDNVGIKRCDELTNLIVAIREQIDHLNEQAKSLREDSEKYEQELQRILEHFGKKNWKTPSGTIELRERSSVKVPDSPEDKKALFEWMQSKGIFWRYANVNSQSLNALYRSEAEIAATEGKEFTLPGVGAPTVFTQIAVKKGR
jgi:hypothetical protein